MELVAACQLTHVKITNLRVVFISRNEHEFFLQELEDKAGEKEEEVDEKEGDKPEGGSKEGNQGQCNRDNPGQQWRDLGIGIHQEITEIMVLHQWTTMDAMVMGLIATLTATAMEKC